MTSLGEAGLCVCSWGDTPSATSCLLGTLGDPPVWPSRMPWCAPSCPGARVRFAEALMEHGQGRAATPGGILGFLPHVSSVLEVLGMARCKTPPRHRRWWALG